MMTTLIAIAAVLQDSPLEVPKAEWPAEAECTICSAKGAGHGPEVPAAALRYKGTTFYFCNKQEPAEFKKDPEAFLPPVLPRPIPKFELMDKSGTLWSADSFRERVLLIDFWATWCAPCKKMMPILKELRTQFAPKGMELLSVSIDEKASDLDKYLSRNAASNPVLHDTVGTWESWKVRVVPTLFLVKDSQIVGQWSGIVKKEVLVAALESALKAK